MKICIVGAGNMGLVMAGVIAAQNKHQVVIFTNKKLDSNFVFYDVEKNEEYTDLSIECTDDLSIALKDANYIFCTYPAFLRKQFVENCKNLVEKGSKIGFIPGYGGAEYACKHMIENGVTVFGLQRVPYIARQNQQKTAHLLSKKKELFVGAIPADSLSEICVDLEMLLSIPCNPVEQYLSVTLTPTNPLIHLSGVYIDFKDYEEGDFYTRQLMFYDEWNDETSEVMFAYDEELQQICENIDGLDLHEVVSLKEYYESPTIEVLTKKLKSIEAFKVVKVPLVCREDKYYPDWNNRMFTEDFPFGIAIIKYFAILTNTNTPTIDKVLEFYREKRGVCYFNEDGTFGKDIKDTGIPALYGLDSIDKIVDFYRQ